MKSKATSRIIVTLLIAIVTMVASTLSVFAAGTETWYEQFGPWESIRVTDTNLTPVKTIGRNGGRLRIAATVTACKSDCTVHDDPEDDWYPPVVMTCKIISYPSGEVLASGIAYENGSLSILTSRELEVGEQVQIFFDISSQYSPPGPFRKAHVNFAYQYER